MLPISWNSGKILSKEKKRIGESLPSKAFVVASVVIIIRDKFDRNQGYLAWERNSRFVVELQRIGSLRL